MSNRQHGTYVKYKLDCCRCYQCGYAASQYAANRNRAIAYGTWQPYVDAAPARLHVQALMEFGIGWKRIAAIAGVPTGVLTKLLYGDPQRGLAPFKQIRPKNATALLKVEPTMGNLGSVAAIDATGTRRRLQALVASGWPQARLAARLNMTPGNFSGTMRRPQVTVRTARLAAALYDELWREDPRAHGVDNQAYSRARNHASTRAWAPVGAWDDDTIDDPQAQPCTGEQQHPNREELATIRREEVEHLDRCGLSESEIATRLKVSARHVRDTLRHLHGDPPSACPPGPEPVCGEPRMYRRHLKNGDPPCPVCRAANAAADRRYRLTGSQKETAA